MDSMVLSIHPLINLIILGPRRIQANDHQGVRQVTTCSTRILNKMVYDSPPEPCANMNQQGESVLFGDTQSLFVSLLVG